MIRQHPRLSIVKVAEREMSNEILRIVEENDLTSVEVARYLAEETSRWLKYVLRSERHPNEPDKGADEA